MVALVNFTFASVTFTYGMCRSRGRFGKFYICFGKFYLSVCVVRVAASVNFTFVLVPFALAFVNFTYRIVARVVAKKSCLP